MAQFLIQVHYQQGTGAKWSNVWRVDATDLATAAAAASGTLAPGLLPILDTSCRIVSVLTSTPGTPGAFITEALGLAGTNTSSGELLPFFNAMKVLFPILSGGRPDYKYLKGLANEGNTSGGVFSGTITGAVASILTGLISDMATAGALLVENGGTNYSVVTPQSEVAMRQQHRKRRRSA